MYWSNFTHSLANILTEPPLISVKEFECLIRKIHPNYPKGWKFCIFYLS